MATPRQVQSRIAQMTVLTDPQPEDSVVGMKSTGEAGRFAIGALPGGGGTGNAGASAYEVAVANGFSGTQAQWLASLKGADGINGTNGTTPSNAALTALITPLIPAPVAGPKGDKGDTGATGPPGSTTIAGISGLQAALDGKQPASGNLDAFAAVAPTIAGLALLDDVNAAAQRATLGLGTLATQSGTFSGTSSGTNTGDQDLSALAPKASPTFTGTVSGVTKAMVGLANVDNTADTAKPVSTAQQTALDLKANLTSPALVTPNIGAATGTSLAATGVVTATGGIGYAAGAGGAVTQATSKATGVTLNKLCGTITMNAAALAAAAIVTFTVTNSAMAATDVVVCQHDSGGTIGSYTIAPNTSATGSFKITVRNNSAASLSEAIVIRFAIIKAVTA